MFFYFFFFFYLPQGGYVVTCVLLRLIGLSANTWMEDGSRPRLDPINFW